MSLIRRGEQMPYEEVHHKHDGPAGIEFDARATHDAVEFLNRKHHRPILSVLRAFLSA